METVDKEFQKGFNNGYLIAKHEPELSAALTKGIEPTNEYTHGLLSGQKEFEKEKDIEKNPPRKDRDIERDR